MENPEPILIQNKFNFKESNHCNAKKEWILKFYCQLFALDLLKRLPYISWVDWGLYPSVSSL